MENVSAENPLPPASHRIGVVMDPLHEAFGQIVEVLGREAGEAGDYVVKLSNGEIIRLSDGAREDNPDLPQIRPYESTDAKGAAEFQRKLMNLGAMATELAFVTREIMLPDEIRLRAKRQFVQRVQGIIC